MTKNRKMRRIEAAKQLASARRVARRVRANPAMYSFPVAMIRACDIPTALVSHEAIQAIFEPLSRYKTPEGASADEAAEVLGRLMAECSVLGLKLAHRARTGNDYAPTVEEAQRTAERCVSIQNEMIANALMNAGVSA